MLSYILYQSTRSHIIYQRTLPHQKITHTLQNQEITDTLSTKRSQIPYQTKRSQILTNQVIAGEFCEKLSLIKVLQKRGIIMLLFETIEAHC